MQNILVIEDHDDARNEMVSILNSAFQTPTVRAVATLSHARKKFADQMFDLVVLDLDLPDGRGEDFLSEMLMQHPNLYVVISTIHDESERLLKALQAGAKGYLLKEQSSEHLISEFQGIRRGKPALAPTVTRRLLEFFRAKETAAGGVPVSPAPVGQDRSTPDGAGANGEAVPLTDREEEVLVLLSKGFNRPEIAGVLGISKHTVATHVDKVYRKLDVSSRGEAAVVAAQRNLI